jgi:hypothetical protein
MESAIDTICDAVRVESMKRRVDVPPVGCDLTQIALNSSNG